jgi:hypothetical protein
MAVLQRSRTAALLEIWDLSVALLVCSMLHHHLSEGTSNIEHHLSAVKNWQVLRADHHSTTLPVHSMLQNPGPVIGSPALARGHRRESGCWL